MSRASAQLRLLKRCLANRLASLAVAERGDLIWWKLNDTVVILETQKDRYSPKEGPFRFTINVGISIDVLRAFEEADSGLPAGDPPSSKHWHWNARLGRLLPDKDDRWWSIENEESINSTCEEIASDFFEHALPIIRAAASSEALLEIWRKDRGPGLTEYQRRLNLAKLLTALARNVEAIEAVDALEQASQGSSWKASAAYDVRELRKRL
jgi:hypothetical protein